MFLSYLFGGIKRMLSKSERKPKLPKRVPSQRKTIRKTSTALFITFRQWRNCEKQKVIPKIPPDVQSLFQRLYNEQEAAKKIKKPLAKPNLWLTNHAKIRFAERFNPHGYAIEDIIEDAARWRNYMKAAKDGKVLVRWRLWKYIVSKDFYIVTMFPNGSKM